MLVKTSLKWANLRSQIQVGIYERDQSKVGKCVGDEKELFSLQTVWTQ